MHDDRAADRLLNLFVWAPLAFYAARGQTPPPLVTLVALGYTGYTVLRDVNEIAADIQHKNLLPAPPKK